MKQKWLLSVRTPRDKREFLFTQRDGESPIELYRRVKQQKAKVEAKFSGKPVTVELISHGQAFKPPKDWKPPRKIATGRGRNWCPYCIKFRIMIWDDYLGVYRCPVCGITENDFHFRKYNGLFEAAKEEWLLNM